MQKELENLLKDTRGYIFDLDGTLADSEKLQWEAHKQLLKKMYNIDVDDAHIFTYLGNAEAVVLTMIEKDYNIDMGGEKGYEKYKKARNKLAAKLVIKQAVPFDYAREVLRSAGLGIKYCLVTAQNPHLVKQMLKKWNFTQYFNDANTYICDKDHTKPFFYDYFYGKVLRNAKPEQVVLFEDVNKYLGEAKSRGFKTVGIDNNFGSEALVADVVIKTQK